MYRFLFLFAPLVFCNEQALPSTICPHNNMYIPVEGKNFYIECKDFQPITKTCPEDFYLNSNTQWPENPCQDNPPSTNTLPPSIPHVEPEVTTKASICDNKGNGYLDEGFCDTYIECLNSKPIKRRCPDGLHFNPDSKWPYYPCSYPNEAPCHGREQTRIPKPTADCQRQNGMFPSPKAASECGKYIICSAGIAFDMHCPLGLAFNPELSICDWPKNVAACNADEFYGSQCPPGEIDESGNPVVTNLKHGNDCHFFISCQNGKGVLLSCDPGFAFNAETGHCDVDHLDCNTQTTTRKYYPYHGHNH